MKAKEVNTFMRKAGTWVNWDHTCDQFLAGDPELEIRGIAVSWMPTFSTIKKALDERCNLFVTHEPLYTAIIDKDGNVIEMPDLPMPREGRKIIHIDKDDAWVKKKKWLNETKMIVYRCHDFWDSFPEIGIHGAWADWLGFTDKPIKEDKFYEVHNIGNCTLASLVENILTRVKSLGQETINVVGNLNKKVTRIAVGTGAITNYREMYNMGADVLVVTDDGIRLWETGQWSIDSDIPLIIVSHSTSEEPGMRTLSRYIEKNFPGIPVKYIPVGCMYRSIYLYN